MASLTLLPNTVLESDDINTKFVSIKNNIIDLYNKTTLVENKQWEMDIIAYATIESITNSIRQFSDELEEYLSYGDSPPNYINISLYDADNIIYPSSMKSFATHESNYGRAVLPNITTTSQSLFITKSTVDETIKVMDDIDDYIQLKSYNTAADTEIIKEQMTDIVSAFDYSNNSSFIKTVKTTNPDIHMSDLTIEIRTPGIDFTVNDIKIDPFPENGTIIESISYLDTAGKEYFFKNTFGSDVFDGSVDEKRKKGVALMPATITSMKILLAKYDPKITDNIKDFYLGLHNLSISNNIYNSIGYIGFVLNRGDGVLISTISSIDTNLIEMNPDLHQILLYDNMDDFNDNNTTNALYNSDIDGFLGEITLSESMQELYLLVKLIKPEIEQYTPELKSLQINLT